MVQQFLRGDFLRLVGISSRAIVGLTGGNRALPRFSCAVLLFLCIALGISCERERDGRDFQGGVMGFANLYVRHGLSDKDSTFQRLANVKVYFTNDAQLQAGESEPGIIAFSRADGAFILWDPLIGGGKRNVTAIWAPPDRNSETAHQVGDEGEARALGPNYVPSEDTFRKTHNVGWAPLLF
jgi:hypothetical protein